MTEKAAARRVLRFAGIKEMIADADALAVLERAGKLRSAGAWTLGQAMHHLASWADYAYAGLPIKIPLPLRILFRPMKQRAIYKPMPAGLRIPRIAGGTLAIVREPLDTAQPRLHRSFERLKSEAPTLPHPIFGPLTHDEWINLNLRHCELHLSFFGGA